jgi:hypothetical protein
MNSWNILKVQNEKKPNVLGLIKSSQWYRWLVLMTNGQEIKSHLEISEWDFYNPVNDTTN